MKIIAKGEVLFKGDYYVYVIYENNTYEIFSKEEYEKKHRSEKIDNFSQISKDEIKSILTSNTNNSNSLFDSGENDTLTNEISSIFYLFICIAIISVIYKLRKIIWAIFKNIQLLIPILICICILFTITYIIQQKKDALHSFNIFYGIISAFLGFGGSMFFVVSVMMIILIISSFANSNFNEQIEDMFKYINIFVFSMTVGGGFLGLFHFKKMSKLEFLIGPCVLGGIFGLIAIFRALT